MPMQTVKIRKLSTHSSVAHWAKNGKIFFSKVNKLLNEIFLSIN